MDSLTQLALGSAVTAACVPAAHRRAGLLIGALLGTLPDLDVLPLSLLDLDPVQQMTLHRGATHSLLILPFAALLIWWALRAWWSPASEAPRAWLMGILLALVTHPLLDAMTVYGTQLFWPLPASPVMGSSVFIIDPLYTLPLLAGCVGGWWWRHRPAGTRLLAAGLMLSTAYLGWSWTAKAMIERQVAASLVGTGLEAAPRFSVPQPFQTVLWRAVVMTPEGYLEAERSLWADRGPLRWRHHKADDALLEQLADVPAVQRLKWFNRGFMRMAEQDGRAIATDLRMGAEPNYVFNFIVAERNAWGQWQSIQPLQQRPRFGDRDLSRLWQRIWTEPSEAADQAGG